MKTQNAFTILELMITVAIAGVLAAVGIPNYNSMVKNNCLTTDSNAIVSSFNLARIEAIKRQTNVTITAANADANNEWGLGWNVTLDEDSDGDAVLDPGEDYNGNGVLDAAALVRTVDLSCGLTTLNETGDRTTFTYGRNGMISSRGTFEVCDDRVSETGRQINMSVTGRLNTNNGFVCL